MVVATIKYVKPHDRRAGPSEHIHMNPELILLTASNQTLVSTQPLELTLLRS